MEYDAAVRRGTKLFRTTTPDYAGAFQSTAQPLLIIAADPPKFTMLAANAAHTAAFHTTSEALIGHGVFEVFSDNLSPEATQFVEAVRASLNAVIETGTHHRMEERALAINGPNGRDVRYWTAAHTPVFNAQGDVVQIVSAVQDITGEVRERRGEEMRQLLVRELDHRGRNMLTIMQTFVRLTQANSVDDFRSALEGRVAALARAQNVLASGQWEHGQIRDLVRAKVSTMAEKERVDVSGPDLTLTAEAVQSLSMVLHELATNARKYGALATPHGRISISWRRQGEQIELVWDEQGAEALESPGRSGFGSRLIDRLLKQLGGRSEFEWRPTGVAVRLVWNLESAPP